MAEIRTDSTGQLPLAQLKKWILTWLPTELRRIDGGGP